MAVRVYLSILIFIFSTLVCHAVPVQQYKVIKSGPVNFEKPSSFDGDHHTFYGGFDAYSRSLFKTTSSASGTPDMWAPLQYPFELSYAYKFTSKSRFWTQLNYTLFPKKTGDGATEETHLMLKFPYSRKIEDSDFEWKAGLIFHQTRLAGNGGQISLSDGVTSSLFALPRESRTTSNFLSEIGVNYEFKKVLLQSSLLIEAPFNSQARTFAVMFGFSYNLGGF